MNEKIIWNFFEAKELSPQAIAGIMGNLYAESGLDPTRLEKKFQESLMLTEEQYTQMTDDGSYGSFVEDRAAYGLAQWKYFKRKETLLNLSLGMQKSVGDLGLQLEFLWMEMAEQPAFIEKLKNAESVSEASDVFIVDFLRSSNQSAEEKRERADFSETYYEMFPEDEIVVPPEIPEISADFSSGEDFTGTIESIAQTSYEDSGAINATAPVEDEKPVRGFRVASGAIDEAFLEEEPERDKTYLVRPKQIMNVRRTPTKERNDNIVKVVDTTKTYEVLEETMDDKGNIWCKIAEWDSEIGWAMREFLEKV